MMDRKQIADIIKDRRESLGWSQRELSRRFGKKKGLVSFSNRAFYFEEGKRDIGFENFTILLDVLGLDIEIIEKQNE